MRRRWRRSQASRRPGVPRAEALARELSALEPALLQAATGAPSEGGFLEKLQSNAERLVRIRPVEEVAGEEPAAVIARAEIKAGRGDVAGALVEIENLAGADPHARAGLDRQGAGARGRPRGEPRLRGRCAGGARQAVALRRAPA